MKRYINNCPKDKWNELTNQKHKVVGWIEKLYVAFRRSISAAKKNINSKIRGGKCSKQIASMEKGVAMLILDKVDSKIKKIMRQRWTFYHNTGDNSSCSVESN